MLLIALFFFFQRGRVCGLKDSETLCASQGVLHFPSHYPDTEAGKRHQNDVMMEQIKKYSRKPTSKRTNYQKYGVALPFDPPWKELVANWCSHGDKSKIEQRTSQKVGENDDKFECKQDFFVLRASRVLRALSSLCQ